MVVRVALAIQVGTTGTNAHVVGSTYLLCTPPLCRDRVSSVAAIHWGSPDIGGKGPCVSSIGPNSGFLLHPRWRCSGHRALRGEPRCLTRRTTRPAPPLLGALRRK